MNDNHYDKNNYDMLTSIVLGILCGIMIYRFYLCASITRGPNSRDIVDKVYKVDGKYYELIPIICGCLR